MEHNYGSNSLGFPILSLITLLPLVGAVVIALLPKRSVNAIRWTAVAVSGINLLLTLIVVFGFAWGTEGYQFVERWVWAPGLGWT